MRLVAYLRVSTDRQADEGYGLDVQREAVTRWAGTHGHTLVSTCTDEGVSGTVDALDREGLACVVETVRDGDAEGVIVARLDRLARVLTVQEATLALLWRTGATVFTADGGEVRQDDPDDPMRTAMRQMVGVFGELERAMIAKRLRDGRKAKRGQGGYAFGAPPFGWRSEAGRLVPVPSEQTTIDIARKLRAEGLTLEAIAERLNIGGFPTRRAGRWHAATVGRILRPVTGAGRTKRDDAAA